MPKGRSGIITEDFKGKENTAYHDVEKLFKIYRSVNWKMQIKINQVKRHFQLEYGTDMQELKERVREVTIGYVTELLGTFRELGIDFRTTQTVFMGGGAILVSEIIKVVWERFKGEYFIINDPKANAKGYKLQFQMEEFKEKLIWIPLFFLNGTCP